MNATVVENKAEEVSPQDIAAVEAALRHMELQHAKQNVLALAAQWFLVLRMFKEVEAGYSKSKSRKTLEAKHRALVSSIMGVGELLIADGGSIKDSEFERIGFSRKVLEANVRYLREKYEQWYFDVSKSALDSVTAKLLDEREVGYAGNLSAKMEA